MSKHRNGAVKSTGNQSNEGLIALRDAPNQKPKLQFRVELDYGHEADSWSCRVPSVLLIDNEDNLYLERWDQQCGGVYEDVGTITVDDGAQKRLDELLEWDITPVSVKAALEWYCRVNDFASGSTGDFSNLCRIAAKALPGD